MLASPNLIPGTEVKGGKKDSMIDSTSATAVKRDSQVSRYTFFRPLIVLSPHPAQHRYQRKRRKMKQNGCSACEEDIQWVPVHGNGFPD